MRAVRLVGRRGPVDLVYEEDVPPPTPEPADALVRVLATGITPAELGWSATWERDGVARRHPIPGHEVVGVVESAPAGAAVQPGDAVYGLVRFDRDGATADFVAVPAGDLARSPRSVDPVNAATLPLSALTAWQALYHRAHLRAGQTVLVHGAAGGVGIFAVQIAHYVGARVVATASPAQRDVLETLGVERIVDYTTQRFEDAVADIDVVLDMVGGATLERSLDVLRPGGTVVTLPAPPPPGRAEEAGVHAVFFVVEPNREDLVRLAALADAGVLRPVVGGVFPLRETRQAFEQGLAGHSRGKIVIDVAVGQRP
jgi:NADPH:quinone reductase-like Zn-dependent oxidoreductase